MCLGGWGFDITEYPSTFIPFKPLLKTESSERSETVRTMYSGIKIDSTNKGILVRRKKKLERRGALLGDAYDHFRHAKI